MAEQSPRCPRCPTCHYMLVRGMCPICSGRQVGDRLPMVAPLPKSPEPAPRRRYRPRDRWHRQ